MAMNEGRVHGYEYDYRFSMVDDFDVESQDDEAYHFEIRTNFILKKHDETITLCWEYFRVYEETLLFLDISESTEPESGLKYQLMNRLREYWMLDHEVKQLVCKALDYFAANNKGGLIVPILVHLDVLTVQRDDEGAGPAFDRAIRVENLFPLRFYRGLLDIIPSNEDDDTVLCLNKQFYLIHHMPRKRVLLHVGSTPDACNCCSICLGESRVGDQISVLDRTCNHAFHYHCIATWLMMNDTCPLCRCHVSNASCDDLDCCGSKC